MQKLFFLLCIILITSTSACFFSNKNLNNHQESSIKSSEFLLKLKNNYQEKDLINILQNNKMDFLELKIVFDKIYFIKFKNDQDIKLLQNKLKEIIEYIEPNQKYKILNK